MRFFISPANTRGRRAEALSAFAGSRSLDPPASATARLGHRITHGQATFEEVFGAISSLYFVGKLAYARRFARGDEIWVLAPGVGLVRPEDRVTTARWERLRATTTRADDSAFAVSVGRAARHLAAADRRQVVFLGSIDPERYLGLLEPLFGARLRVPRRFLGIGSMQRGALLRRRADEGRRLALVRAAVAMEFASDAQRRRRRSG